MRKELFLAIASGALLGLIIAFGIWRANSSLKNGENKIEVQEKETQNKPANQAITIAKLEDNDLITSSPLTITGITKANSLVAISGEETDYIVRANQNGSFEENVKLVGGINNIILTSFDENGNSANETITLVYSSEFAKYQKEPLEENPGDNENSSATSASETIREKVEKKVNDSLTKPVAYIGTITDLTDTSLQIKSSSGEIEQISTNQETTFVKEDKTIKEVQFKDLAIGDFIVAMGFKNGNSVLDSKRILITQTPEEEERKVFFSSLTQTGKNDLTFKTIGQNEENKVNLAKLTLYFSFKDKLSKIKVGNLEENDIVFVFSLLEESGYTARTIIQLIEPGSPETSVSPEASSLPNP